MENLRDPPPLPPQSRMGKWRVFALRAPSSLIWGGMGVCCSILFCPRLQVYRPVTAKQKKEPRENKVRNEKNARNFSKTSF